MGAIEKPEAEPMVVAGKQLSCQMCSSTTFWRKDAVLHGALASFVSLEWLSPKCVCYVCSSCGFIHWFWPREPRKP